MIIILRNYLNKYIYLTSVILQDEGTYVLRFSMYTVHVKGYNGRKINIDV